MVKKNIKVIEILKPYPNRKASKTVSVDTSALFKC